MRSDFLPVIEHQEIAIEADAHRHYRPSHLVGDTVAVAVNIDVAIPLGEPLLTVRGVVPRERERPERFTKEAFLDD
ncbi:MAG TPA: hypothetical protein PKJ17_06520, partial [Syntrophorhabdaceae bacterium]|nr:hypothetical protein [Syntrophorhabdaceae bacterium]